MIIRRRSPPSAVICLSDSEKVAAAAVIDFSLVAAAAGVVVDFVLVHVAAASESDEEDACCSLSCHAILTCNTHTSPSHKTERRERVCVRGDGIKKFFPNHTKKESNIRGRKSLFTMLGWK